jgi:hypothetical protein
MSFQSLPAIAQAQAIAAARKIIADPDLCAANPGFATLAHSVLSSARGDTVSQRRRPIYTGTFAPTDDAA